jgi:hypothetical protein
MIMNITISESRVLASGGAHASYYRRRVRNASRHRSYIIPVRARTRYDGHTYDNICIRAGSRVLASGGARASDRHSSPRSKSYRNPTRASSRSELARGTMMMTMTKKSEHLVLPSASTSAAAAATLSSLSLSSRDRCHKWRRFLVGVVVVLMVNDGVGVHGAVSEPSCTLSLSLALSLVLPWLGGNSFRVSSGVPVCCYCFGGCCSRPAPHSPTNRTTSAHGSFLYLVNALTRRIS